MHGVYMNQAAQGGTGPYTAMPVTGTGTLGSSASGGRAEPKVVAATSALSPRSQHGECLHVPAGCQQWAGASAGASSAHHHPCIFILPAHTHAGLPGK